MQEIPAGTVAGLGQSAHWISLFLFLFDICFTFIWIYFFSNLFHLPSSQSLLLATWFPSRCHLIRQFIWRCFTCLTQFCNSSLIILWTYFSTDWCYDATLSFHFSFCYWAIPTFFINTVVWYQHWTNQFIFRSILTVKKNNSYLLLISWFIRWVLLPVNL